MVKVYDGVAPLDLSSVLRDIAQFRYIRQVCQWLNCLSTMQSGRCRWFVAFLLPGMVAAVSTQTGQQYMDTSAFVRQLGSQFKELPPFAEAFRLPKANLVSLRGLGTWQLTTTITKLRWRLGGRHGWKYEVKPRAHAHKAPTHFPVDISIRHHGTFLPVILCPGVTHLTLCFQVKMKLQSKWTISRCKHGFQFCRTSGKSHALHDIRPRSSGEIVSHRRHHSTSSKHHEVHSPVSGRGHSTYVRQAELISGSFGIYPPVFEVSHHTKCHCDKISSTRLLSSLSCRRYSQRS